MPEAVLGTQVEIPTVENREVNEDLQEAINLPGGLEELQEHAKKVGSSAISTAGVIFAIGMAAGWNPLGWALMAVGAVLALGGYIVKASGIGAGLSKTQANILAFHPMLTITLVPFLKISRRTSTAMWISSADLAPVITIFPDEKTNAEVFGCLIFTTRPGNCSGM